MTTNPILLSPALPSELLSYVLNHHVYPTTLIICSSQVDFLASCSEDIQIQSRKGTPNTTDQQELHEEEPLLHHQDYVEYDTEVKHTLLSSPIYQIATSRHIRIIYVPTVTHLRACLAVFSPDESRVPAPPVLGRHGTSEPHIILYGFLKLHRGTSEWSAQGLSNTSSTLVELAHRLSWKALLIEPASGSRDTDLEELLQDMVPLLNGGARRLGPASEEGFWTGRTVEVGRVLSRWFRFQRAQWSVSNNLD
ncbi:hypothetical protein F5Y03DRAFT_255842 [Xylaria venustula]|nr:hypothetical protein F5Y03DRAFT_255842 [Xylaria venustula]